jgi:hypothetical protein
MKNMIVVLAGTTQPPVVPYPVGGGPIGLGYVGASLLVLYINMVVSYLI